MGSFRDLTGQKFGKLTVIERVNIHNQYKWLCKCECGEYCYALGGSLTSGDKKSCGCLYKEKQLSYHGYSKTRLYTIWIGMKKRCYSAKEGSKDYKNYRGKGITICDEWLNNFMAFREWALSQGYEDTLSIDRIDVNGNYEPTNCRWIPLKQQGLNKTTNHYLTYKGETKIIKEWGMEYHIHPSTIISRLGRGWSVEKALTTPPKKYWEGELTPRRKKKVLKRKSRKHTKKLTYNNKTLTYLEWSKVTGINKRTISSRIESGWSVEKALTTSVGQPQFTPIIPIVT